jgi:hypothetical protein
MVLPVGVDQGGLVAGRLFPGGISKTILANPERIPQYDPFHSAPSA